MTSAALEVRYGAELVGRLRTDDEERFCFAYAEPWLARANRFPISLSLPLLAKEVVAGPAHAFFSNLLPEGRVRTAICARLGISEANDFALLEAIGGDCAGALSVVASGTPADDPDELGYELLSKPRLARLASDADTALLVGGSRTRLSLAGAQGKLPVALLDDKIHLPLRGAPSTHILKLPNQRFPHLPDDEAFTLGLAKRMNLDVVESELRLETTPPSLLVTRYDRVITGDPWAVRRLHQEDLCQALGVPPAKKYEAEGGPDFARCMAVVDRAAVQPLLDTARLIRWQAFNVVAGNSDGHAKNLSILYGDDGARLAPFYDLVSTRQYDSILRQLAMKIGDRANPDEIGRAQWNALARAVHMGVPTVIELVADLARQTLEALPDWQREFRERYGRRAILQTLPAAIAKRARRVLRSLAPPRD